MKNYSKSHYTRFKLWKLLELRVFFIQAQSYVGQGLNLT